MGNRRERRTTATLGACAITRCSCSTSSGTARGPCSVRATYIARATGGRCWIRYCLAMRRRDVRRYFRADAAFAKPDIYEYLEERQVLYAIRLPGNEVLQREIAPLLRRPVGRPPKRPVIRYDDFWYQAGSWNRARRVVAKVEWHRGELFPRVGFIVTNMSAGPEGVVRFLQWSWDSRAVDQGGEVRAELDSAVLPSSSWPTEVRLSLFILAYNLGNFLRRLCLPKTVKHWSLRSVQVKLIKMGGRLVRHSRRLIFQLAEVAVPREVFRQVLERIGGLHAAPG